jgi:hypothetical protein
MRVRVYFAWILLATTPAPAATITVSPQRTDRPMVVMIEGALGARDEEQFAAKTASLSSAFVAFSSDGGDFVAGVRIGEAIRRKKLSTIVPDGRRCASACALAWLGGVERFIGSDARLRFHAASNSASDTENDVVKAMVSTYLAEIGLSHEVVTYITQAASNEPVWLNMSGVAEWGIRVTLLSSRAGETTVTVPTRYGDITLTRDGAICCTAHITYGDQRVEIASTGQIHANLEGAYKVKEGDLLVMSFLSGARGRTPRYQALLIDQEGITDLTAPGFGSSDGTFKSTQRGDEIHFNLGFEERKKKTAIYKNKTITMNFRPLGPEAIVSKHECATILNMVVTCVRLSECSDETIFEKFATAGQRYFKRLEEMTVFTSRNFYNVCTAICTSNSYVAKQARSTLCGY